MAQAAEVLPFPSKKLTFKAEKINCKAVLKRYDENRPYVGMAMHILTKTPTKLKKEAANLRDTGHEKGIQADALEKLASDFRSIADEYEALCELLRASSARLIATNLGLT